VNYHVPKDMVKPLTDAQKLMSLAVQALCYWWLLSVSRAGAKAKDKSK